MRREYPCGEFGKEFTSPGIFGIRMSDFLRDYL
ncbi:MAG: hypothetical protein ACI8V4_003167, partial [Ilumatobacter sp.]